MEWDYTVIVPSHYFSMFWLNSVLFSLKFSHAFSHKWLYRTGWFRDRKHISGYLLQHLLIVDCPQWFTLWSLLSKENNRSLRISVWGRLEMSLPRNSLPVSGLSSEKRTRKRYPRVPSYQHPRTEQRGRQHLKPVWFPHIALNHRSD